MPIEAVPKVQARRAAEQCRERLDLGGQNELVRMSADEKSRGFDTLRIDAMAIDRG